MAEAACQSMGRGSISIEVDSCDFSTIGLESKQTEHLSSAGAKPMCPESEKQWEGSRKRKKGADFR